MLTGDAWKGHKQQGKKRLRHLSFWYENQLGKKRGPSPFQPQLEGLLGYFGNTAQKQPWGVGGGGGVADRTDTIHHKHHGSMNNSNVYFYYFSQAVKNEVNEGEVVSHYPRTILHSFLL